MHREPRAIGLFACSPALVRALISAFVKKNAKYLIVQRYVESRLTRGTKKNGSTAGEHWRIIIFQNWTADQGYKYFHPTRTRSREFVVFFFVFFSLVSLELATKHEHCCVLQICFNVQSSLENEAILSFRQR